MAVAGRGRPGPQVARGRRETGGARAVLIAVVSTAIVFTGLGFAIVNAPGWSEIHRQFFDWGEFRATFPEIASAFLLNVKIFCIAEAIILVTALVVAVVRSLPGPAFFPLRVLAIIYADFFRGVPTILVITLLGFGAPALGLKGVPTSTTFWGIVALVLVYTAYVSEVYRAGIESVHPSQEAAARSLGLTRMQSMQHVVLPQAVRRVMPPLLNDFIGLQKDTALVGVLGSVEAFKQTQIDQAATFNFTSGLAAAVLFVAVTVPLTRLVDWLLGRSRRRRQAALAVA
jgi:polar amino acid transport system permease protein